jgi:hypothetical protein
MKIACATAMLALATIGTANVAGCLKGAVGGRCGEPLCVDTTQSSGLSVAA